MRARAPGKLVLSGAYAVLEGAPAVVSAVDRYVYCDSERAAEQVTPEVRAALRTDRAPYFDASALREDGRKLGLGSSAAILVASLACLSEGPGGLPLREQIFAPALRAHREAQGGGSGIDVAASTWGGTLIARRSGDGLELEKIELPRELVVETWWSGQAASTPDLIARVTSLKTRQPAAYDTLLGSLRAAAASAARALQRGEVQTWLRQLNVQRELLAQLGSVAQAPIITPSVAELARAGEPLGAVLPSGAGGGDVVLWVGQGPSPGPLRALAHQFGYVLVQLSLGAAGAERLPGAASGS